jgi:hypothetical protein
MSDNKEQAPFLLQLAISLRLAAQRLADSAARMHQAVDHQRQQLEQLTLLRDRIVELLAVCRRMAEKEAPAPALAPAPVPALRPATPAPRAPAQAQTRLPASAFVEFSNWQEFEKFRRMTPITDQEVESCNIEDLIRRLATDPGPGAPKP